jgi:hypothetical protein
MRIQTNRRDGGRLQRSLAAGLGEAKLGRGNKMTLLDIVTYYIFAVYMFVLSRPR